MPLDLNRERERMAKVGGGGSFKDKFWRPKPGENRIRILKFSHKVTKEDIEGRLFGKESLGKEVTDWCYPFQIHFGLVPENRNIPVRSTQEILDKLAELDVPKEVMLKIRPNNRFALNIIDLNDVEKGVQVAIIGTSIWRDVVKYLVDADYGESVLGAKGLDWKITYNKDVKDPKLMYETMIQPEKSSRPMNPKVEKMTLDLYDPEINQDFARTRGLEELDFPGASEEAEEASTSKANGKKGAEKDDIFDI